MRSILCCLLTVAVILGFAVAALPATPTEASLPLAPAEAAAYSRTAHLAEVWDYIHALQRVSPLIRVERLLTSTDGWDVPLLVLGDPLPTGPLESLRCERPVVYIQANIHGGEVEGKDALLEILRDLVAGSRREVLRQIVLVIVPVLNADGNEKVSPLNRNQYPNPAEGVGERSNGQNLDLNRDYVKTDSREVRAVLGRVLLRWDPLVTVDLHTTDGSFHEETVTWLSPRTSNWDTGISGFLWGSFYPEIQKKLASKGIGCLPYGDFVDDARPEAGWRTISSLPRIGVDYVGLRNRFSILLEMYAHAPYPVRVAHCRAFLEELLDFVSHHGSDMMKLAREADTRSASWALCKPSERPRLCLTSETMPFESPIEIHTWAVEPSGKEYTAVRPLKDQPRTVRVPFLGRFEGKEWRDLPWAYVLGPGCEDAVRQLRRHGIVVERIHESREAALRQFRTSEIKLDPLPGQGRVGVTVSGSWQDASGRIPAGAWLVRLDQPLSMLAASLLEPEYGDSLVHWGFFNPLLTAQWSRTLPPLPMWRIEEALPLVTRVVEDRDLD